MLCTNNKKSNQHTRNQLVENIEKKQLDHDLTSKEKGINVLQVKLVQSHEQVNGLVMSVNALTYEIGMNQRCYDAHLDR